MSQNQHPFSRPSSRLAPGQIFTRGSATRRKRPVVPTGESRFRLEELESRHMLTEVVPDFHLVDVNATSPTYNQSVSPRDFLGQVSAWYFGHAT